MYQKGIWLVFDEEQEGQYLHSKEENLRSEQVFQCREVTRCQIMKKNVLATAKTLAFTSNELGSQWKIGSKGNITGLNFEVIMNVAFYSLLITAFFTHIILFPSNNHVR